MLWFFCFFNLFFGINIYIYSGIYQELNIPRIILMIVLRIMTIMIVLLSVEKALTPLAGFRIFK